MHAEYCYRRLLSATGATDKTHFSTIYSVYNYTDLRTARAKSWAYEVSYFYLHTLKWDKNGIFALNIDIFWVYFP